MESQVKMETIFVEQGIKSKKPFQSKIQTSLDHPLEREPRVKVSVPKPVPRGEEQDITEHESPLDGLMFVDRENQSKTFGFYGKNFRKDHNSALDFMMYRTAESVQHPNARFNIMEDEFVSTYVDLFYYCPTPEDYFNKKVITDTCEDHRLRIADDDRMRQRSEKAKQEFVKNKEVLATQVKLAGKDEMAYDDLITDITELFLSGEAITRDKDSVGSSSKSLTVLFWNLGNWQRGNNWKVPANLEYQKLLYKENKPDEYPFHIPEDNNLFLQMVKNLRAHVILNCEATTLVPFRKYLEGHGWTLCFNDATDLRCLARLGVGGSIRQIGGPQEKSQEEIWNGPKRRVSFAIYEIVNCLGQGSCPWSFFRIITDWVLTRRWSRFYSYDSSPDASNKSVHIPCEQRWRRQITFYHWWVFGTHDVWVCNTSSFCDWWRCK